MMYPFKRLEKHQITLNRVLNNSYFILLNYFLNIKFRINLHLRRQHSRSFVSFNEMHFKRHTNHTQMAVCVRWTCNRLPSYAMAVGVLMPYLSVSASVFRTQTSSPLGQPLASSSSACRVLWTSRLLGCALILWRFLEGSRSEFSRRSLMHVTCRA